MSLADQLLDYSSDEDVEVEENPEEEVNEEEEQVANININLTTIDDITKVSKLQKKLEPVIAKIDNDLSATSDYDFILLTNSYTAEIISEIAMIHNYIKLHYNSIFPELDTLVPSPVDYAKTVRILGDNIQRNISQREDELREFLPKEKLLVITMSSSLKQSDYEIPDITNIIKACDLVCTLDSYHSKIMNFVSLNIDNLAPNLSQLIGPFTTAQLISSVESLQNLAMTPSCNLPALGNKRQIGIGYGSGGAVKFQGYLYESEFIQNIPDDYKKQALRMLSGKIILCARIDLSKSSTAGELGLKYKNELLEKLDKLMAPPEKAKVKALPVPIDQKSKKRGGKRFSKLKKNFEMSDLQKLQNKMSFGEREETYIDGYGNEIGLGMSANSNNSGKLRMLAANSGAKAKMSKKMANRLANSANSSSDFAREDGSLTFGGNSNGDEPKQLENGGNRWFEDQSLNNRKRAMDDLQSKILKKLKKE